MRIALHAGTLRGFGSGTVGRNILSNLAHVGAQHSFLAWVPQSWADDHGVTPDSVDANVELRFTRPGLLNKLTLENRTIRRALRAWDADVLFSASDTSLVACPVPHLLLIHQANLAYGAAERGFVLGPAAWLRWRAMANYLRLGLSSVDRLTVQTEDMATRISRRFGFSRDRIDVVPSAVSFADQPPGDVPMEAAEPYVVYVASPGQHKNFEVLATMMDQLRERCPALQCRLTVSPAEVPSLVRSIERRGVADRFVFEGHVSHARTLELLRGAKALVMPSWLESFGLPYYEAMMQGTPVVAADRAFAREACGSAGVYVDPTCGRSFAEAVERLVLDEVEQGERSIAAKKRFEETARTWEEIAREYLRILEGLKAEAHASS